MRLFVNSDIYPAYRRQFDEEWGHLDTFAARRRAFLDDRYSAVHFLKPVLDGEEWAFFTNGDDEVLQRMWAREHGMARTRDASTILLAQIEEHRTEVFYNFDPVRFPSNFVRRLPGTVKHAIAWRAALAARAGAPCADLSDYDVVVCNFPSLIQQWRDRGWRAEYFFPSHDPVMDAYAARTERCVDVSFVGSYSRHHPDRGKVLTAVAQLSARYNVRFHLNNSRLTNLAEHPLARFLPVARFRRPRPIQQLTLQPVFGRKLYDTLASSKVALNIATDIAGRYRGNMRCFEAMGCAAVMLSDDGIYPEGMHPERHFVTYRDPTEAVAKATEILEHWPRYEDLGRRAHASVRQHYSKERQWDAFVSLVSRCKTRGKTRSRESALTGAPG
jgi:hypothetical protein